MTEPRSGESDAVTRRLPRPPGWGNGRGQLSDQPGPAHPHGLGQPIRLDPYQLLVLPNYIQLGGSDRTEATTVRVVRAERDLRYDQTFPLAVLVDRTERGQLTVADGLAELDHIHRLRPRFPAWVNVIGYAVESTAFALILQPTAVALLAATGFGLLVGGLGIRATGSS